MIIKYRIKFLVLLILKKIHSKLNESKLIRLLGGKALKVVTVRLEDKVHKELKMQMVSDETTFQDYIVELIQADKIRKKEKN